MSDYVMDIARQLQGQIESFRPQLEVRAVGTVSEAGDGIARATGLSDVRAQELVRFANGVMGIAFNLERESVGIIIMGEYAGIEEGMLVQGTGRIASVPVGEALVGRVVNPLGQPLDGKGPVITNKIRPIERIAPGVIARQDVDTPLETGIKAIDSMTPIGRGQRELIIGDRQTGKTALAVDTIINQKGKGVICIYIAIGQKKAGVARLVGLLEQHGAMEHTIVVESAADEPAALQYIAPYAGCAMGEEIMENGGHALIVYDDLSKHAWAYRQVSLLLRRPPGREAYPGDVFYLHSRLLERAAQLAREYVIVPKGHPGPASVADAVNGKVYTGPVSLAHAQQALKEMADGDAHRVAGVAGSGGSLTALPIIETLLGDVAAYIPTNVISITDGQIYLESNLFYAGIRPAINVGISVSRVGGAAQPRAIRQVAGKLRLDMASFRELAAFAQFGSDLDKSTQAQLDRGYRLQEILKQGQYQPAPMERIVVVLYAGTNGYADKVALDRMVGWESALVRFIETSYPEILTGIAEQKKITDENDARLKEALTGFMASWQA